MFQPIYALKVCSKLMLQSVVRFTIEDKQASDKALQMFCYIHRFFLQMAKEYPAVLTTANEALSNFINNPSHRSRAKTPDIGDLLLYLTITSEFSWEDLKKVYLQEAYRRSARFVKATAGHVTLPSLDTEDKVFEYWLRGGTLEEVMQMYDSRWGLLPDEKQSALKKGYEDILQARSLQEVLVRLGMPMEKEPLVELILWAFENKEENGRVEWEDFPTSGGHRYEDWKERVELFKQADSVPTPTIPPYPKRTYKPDKIDGLSFLLSSMDVNSKPSIVHIQECGCERCVIELEKKKQAQRWQQKFHNSDKSESQGENEAPTSVPEVSKGRLKDQLFVGRLPKTMPKDELQHAIHAALNGKAKHVEVVVDKFTGKLKGYAFVELDEGVRKEDVLAEKIELCGKEILIDTIKGSGNDTNFLPMYP